jgi:hypothetical protein
MVLSRARFQRSDLAGRTVSPDRPYVHPLTMLVQARSNDVRLSHGSRITPRRLMPLHGGDQWQQSYKGLAS